MGSLRLGAAALALAACAASPVATTPPAAPTPLATPIPLATPTPVDSPLPAPTSAPTSMAPAVPPPDPPQSVAVTLGGLPAGSHPVHLHSICNGGQGYHLATLGALGGGTSTLDLPSDDFGRGWCLVVYTDGSLSRVLEYKAL